MNPTPQDDLDKQVEKAFKHTAKLVPESQRELFLYECVKITKILLHQERSRARIDELKLIANSSDDWAENTEYGIEVRVKERIATLNQKEQSDG